MSLTKERRDEIRNTVVADRRENAVGDLLGDLLDTIDELEESRDAARGIAIMQRKTCDKLEHERDALRRERDMWIEVAGDLERENEGLRKAS